MISDAGVPTVGSRGSDVPCGSPSPPLGGIHPSTLELQCHHFLRNGLAPATCSSYASSQRRFIDFCTQLRRLGPYGSPCPTEEWTLCLFITHLAQSVCHTTIEVYLSAVRALHIEQGFADPLVNCLRLQRVLRGIKRSRGDSRATRHPVTASTLLIIFKSLDLNITDHAIFWASCNLAYFGFLRSAEFMVPNLASFSPDVHLSLEDIAVDYYELPTLFRVCLKASKRDPFDKGCFIHLSRGNSPLCAVQSLISYLNVRGKGAGPLFLFQDGRLLSWVALADWLRRILSAAGIPGSFSSHSFRIGAVTVAARNGVPDHWIQALGRWSSNVYQLYIRTPSESLARLSSQLA